MVENHICDRHSGDAKRAAVLSVHGSKHIELYQAVFFLLLQKKEKKNKTLPVSILLEEFINIHLFNVPFIVHNLLSNVRVLARVSRHTLCELTPSLGFTMWASSCEACSLRGAAVVVAARLCCDFALAFPALA